MEFHVGLKSDIGFVFGLHIDGGDGLGLEHNQA